MHSDHYHISLQLPLVTSLETIIVKGWLTDDTQRHKFWSQKAHDLVLQQCIEAAAYQLSSLLCAEVTKDLDGATGLGQTLVEATIRRVNFFELAVGLLRPYDTSGYFDPLPQVDPT